MNWMQSPQHRYLWSRLRVAFVQHCKQDGLWWWWGWISTDAIWPHSKNYSKTYFSSKNTHQFTHYLELKTTKYFLSKKIFENEIVMGFILIKRFPKPFLLLNVHMLNPSRSKIAKPPLTSWNKEFFTYFSYYLQTDLKIWQPSLSWSTNFLLRISDNQISQTSINSYWYLDKSDPPTSTSSDL